MAEWPDILSDIQVTLSLSAKELKALKELGQRLALEGEPISTGVSARTAIELAVNFIVSANLWEARQALGLSGENDGGAA